MNVLQYAATEEANFEKQLKDNSGYQRMTTFYSDLSIAELFGTSAIKDTFDKVCQEWLTDVKYFTEFALALNYKCWEMYERGDNSLMELYKALYYKADDLARDTYTGDEAQYYYSTLD